MSDHWVMGDIQARFLQICWVGFGQGQRPRGGGGQNLKSLSHMAAKVPGAPPPMKNFLPTENKMTILVYLSPVNKSPSRYLAHTLSCMTVGL